MILKYFNVWMLIIVLTCCTLHNLYELQSMLKLMIHDNLTQINLMMSFIALHINFIKKWKCCNNQFKYARCINYVATLLWKSEGMTPSLPKWGFGNPSGLLKFQSLIVGVKTLCIEALFISLEKLSKCKCQKMGSHEPFGHLQHELWRKERWWIELTIWLSTTKSKESTQPRCVQVECDTLLESSWRGL
jgi:hypothetical protein